MGRNLSNLFISSSYQFLTQISGSELQTGLGDKITGSLEITSSKADTATSASYAVNSTSASIANTATSASYATNALSSSFATTASFALNAGATVSTSSLLTTASAAANVITFTKGDGSTFNVTVAQSGSVASASYADFALSASHANNANSALTANTAATASYVLNAVSASFSTTALSASYAATATSSSVAINATSASYADSALSSSYALTASFAANANFNTSSLMVTGSVNSNTLTFTKGDGSTFNLTVNTGSAVTTNTGSLLVTASISNATTTFTKGDGSTFSITANNVVNADSASLAANATSASFATTTISASYATNALSASQAANANTATSASFATNAISASFASTIPNGLSPTFANVTASNVMITGTASVALLYTETVSSSIIYSSGSNQFGDASNDVQTLYGIVDIKNGPLLVSGSTNLSGSTNIQGGDFKVTDQAHNGEFDVDFFKVETVNGSQFTGSVSSLNGFTGSLQGTASFATTASFALNVTPTNTGSLLVTASAAANVITFTKGDASTFNVTVDTGSGAAPFPFSGSAIITGSINAGISNTLLGNDYLGFSSIIASSGSKISGSLGGGTGSIIAGGYNNLIQGQDGYIQDGNFIFGGRDNTVNGGDTGVGIVGGRGNTVSSAGGGREANIIVGGVQCNNATDIGWIFGGVSNNLAGGSNSATIVGGRSNTMNSTGDYANGIFVGENNVLQGSGGGSTIIGGYDNTNNARRSSIIAGRYNIIPQSDSNVHNVILGGNNNTMNTPISCSVILGGSYITASESNTAYVPNLDLSGSLTGSGSTKILQNSTDTYTSSAAIQQVVTLTQVEYNAISGSANANTLYVISDSTPFTTDTFATTGSNTFTGNQVFSGSVRGEVKALTISSNTASLDLSTENFYTLTLVSGSNTFINPLNINPGQTVNLRVTQPSPGFGTISFPSSVKQVSGSAYVPSTGSSAVDVVTFISFDSTNLYLSNVKNLL